MLADLMKDGSIVVAGYYGFGNAGDELILRSLIHQLKRQSPPSRITIFSAQREQTAKHFEVEAVNRWWFCEWILPLWKARRFILGGGGVLQESTGVWNHAYYLSLLVLAKCLGCRTEIIAIGVDPLRTNFNRWWTRFVFNVMVDYASVRDSDSQQALEASGVDRRISRVPDLIFQLTLPEASKAPNHSRGGPSRIALALCAWPERVGWEQDLALLCDRLVSQLNVLIELLVFFPAQDEALARKVAEGAQEPAPVRIWSQPEDLLTWIQDYDLVIGMRYHALALTALAKKPFIGWGSQRKVRTLCRDFSQPLWSFERGWDADAIFRQIGEAWRHRDVLPDRYRSRLLSSTTPLTQLTQLTT